MFTHVYIYIYIERERERFIHSGSLKLAGPTSRSRFKGIPKRVSLKLLIGDLNMFACYSMTGSL